MSHIPASKMPHAHAHDDVIDDQPAQPAQAQPAPEPTTPVPPASASGASPISGKAPDAPIGGSTSRDESPRDGNSGVGGDRSPLAIAAMVVGGLAVVGGLVAALLPLLAPKDEPKSRKRKRRKSA